MPPGKRIRVNIKLKSSHAIALNSPGGDAFGARSAESATGARPLPRDGADASFGKLALGAALIHRREEGISFQTAIRAQTSFHEPLVRSEQASFVSPGLVSGPPSGSVTGDRMIAARLDRDWLEVLLFSHRQPVRFTCGKAGDPGSVRTHETEQKSATNHRKTDYP